MSDKDFHHIKLTKESAEALNKEKTLKDRTWSKTILRILEELEKYREEFPDFLSPTPSD